MRRGATGRRLQLTVGTEVDDALVAASRDGGAVLASLVRRCHGDLELAQDALQDAFEAALLDWPRHGVPRSPAAWLRTTAWRKALDRLRRESTGRQKAALLAALHSVQAPDPGADEPSEIRDDQLKLLFCCCHPALTTEAQVALTLRAVGGLSTTEIARAFLVPEATMAQRIVRAKRKVSAAGIPFRIPNAEELPRRLDGVLGVVYLIFAAGHHATAGDALVRVDLCDEAARLARLLVDLLSDEPEAAGLLALILLHHARRATRVDSAGLLLRLQDQDRSRWDRAGIVEGTRLVINALRRGHPGSYQLQAAIAAIHATAPSWAETDWGRIVALYDQLVMRSPTPVVELNRCVAVTMTGGPEAGLAALDELAAREPTLTDFHRYHSTRAEVLRRIGRPHEAIDAYRHALELATNPVEREFLDHQLGTCQTDPSEESSARTAAPRGRSGHG